ncbi:hypothetical protein KIN20_034216 [Parelaphostrongylus tenuis]|uniref:Peroxisomal membrane protein 4 n=1 Tax=Parelaphostrongylus tenuis TaxID=148309 RepID=A0AAD5WIV4_PARTN|nr:hypothetical protein KIN20_034216 [Parelaphostrongylus tenuis]
MNQLLVRLFLSFRPKTLSPPIDDIDGTSSPINGEMTNFYNPTMITTLLALAEKCERLGNECLLSLNNYHNLLSAVKGFRNGFTYGMKIRAPHALVTVFLFGEGTVPEKIRTIIRLTLIHATNLAKFAFSYKLFHGFLRRAEGKTYQWHSFISAFIVGYFVFGDDNAVNLQIALYLLSRILVSLAKLAVHYDIIPQPKYRVFPLFAALVWGLVLWLFEHHTDVLQGSLVKSMTYIYKDSNYWTDIRNFLFQNK